MCQAEGWLNGWLAGCGRGTACVVGFSFCEGMQVFPVMLLAVLAFVASAMRGFAFCTGVVGIHGGRSCFIDMV